MTGETIIINSAINYIYCTFKSIHLTFQTPHWQVINHRLGLRWIKSLTKDISFCISLFASILWLRTSSFLFSLQVLLCSSGERHNRKWCLIDLEKYEWLRCGPTPSYILSMTTPYEILSSTELVINGVKIRS